MSEAAQPEVATLGEFARLMRVKPSYVTELKRKGRLVLNAKGRVRVKESLALIESTRSPEHDATTARHAASRGSTTTTEHDDESDGNNTSSSNDPHSLRRAKALADKAEIDARAAARAEQIELGLLLRADDVRAVVSDAVSLLRRGLEGMPDMLAPVLAAATEESRVRVLMAEEIERRLADMARSFQTAVKAP